MLGFVVPWDPASRVSLQQHAGSLTEVALPAFSVSPQGDPVYTAREDLFRTAQQTGLPVLAVVTNFTTRFDPAAAPSVSVKFNLTAAAPGPYARTKHGQFQPLCRSQTTMM